jgi:hypothetical protein
MSRNAASAAMRMFSVATQASQASAMTAGSALLGQRASILGGASVSCCRKQKDVGGSRVPPNGAHACSMRSFQEHGLDAGLAEAHAQEPRCACRGKASILRHAP